MTEQTEKDLPSCHACKRTLSEGESAWADDWTVIDTSGRRVNWRTEIRYTCDDCNARPNPRGGGAA